MTKAGRRGAIQPWHPLNPEPKFPYKVGIGFINQEMDAEGNPQIYFQTRNYVLHCIGYIKNTIVWRWHDARQSDRYDGALQRQLRAERGVGRPPKDGQEARMLRVEAHCGLTAHDVPVGEETNE